MGFLEINYNLIKEGRDFFYKKLESFSFDGINEEFEEISFVDTREDAKALLVKKSGLTQRLNSAYAPIKEAKRWSEQFEFDKVGIVTTMFGLGNGILASQLLKRMKVDDLLLIYEPSPMIFRYVMENFDLKELLMDNRVSITVRGINDYEYENLLMGYVTWVNVRSQVICNHTGYDKLFPDEFSWLIKRIHDNNDRAVTNKNTESALSKIFVSNALQNIKYMKESNIITDFIGKFSLDIPAIIVAAGPSLDKNIEELKRAKGKAMILAVDTSLKYLSAHNIDPDFIVTIDPNKDPSHFRNNNFNHVPMFCKMESNAIVLEEHKGRKIFFNLEGYSKDLYNKLGKNTGDLNTGGSVATGAFAICVELGIKNIILIGLDLAYGNGATHAGGVTKDVSNCGLFQETVEDIYGNPITTRHDWYEYLKWFNDAAEFYDKGIVIDATEGGAKIKNTHIMTLHDAINKYCNKDINWNDFLKELPYSCNKDEVGEFYNLIKTNMDEFVTIRDMIHDGINICNRLIKEYDTISGESYTSKSLVVKLNDINMKMEEFSSYLLLDMYCSGTILTRMSEIYQCRDDIQEDKKKIYANTKEIYEDLLNAIVIIKPQLEEVVNKEHEI